jgi:hypothetical protein
MVFLGLGSLRTRSHLGGLGFPRVHATVGTPWQSTIAARGTFARNTLTGLLTGGLQLLELEAEGGNFSNEGVHGRVGFLGEEGSLRRNKCHHYCLHHTIYHY